MASRTRQWLGTPAHRGVHDTFQATVGDLVIGFHDDGSGIAVIEQVSDELDVADIVSRWLDQHVIGNATAVQLWECMPGFYYRRRRELS